MKRKIFSLGKTEAGVMYYIVNGSSEEDIIRKVLGEGLASSRHIVKGAIDRLVEKDLVKRGINRLILTKKGEIMSELIL